MGNNFSGSSVHVINDAFLRGGFVIDRNNHYEVTFHHTVQPTYNKFQIIRYLKTQKTDENGCDRQNSTESNLNFKDSWVSSILSRVSIPAKLRHPSILRVHKTWSNSVDTSYLVVENSVPFNAIVANPVADELLAGSRSILCALDFLHNTLKISHNNVVISSIFADSLMCWKLGGFELSLEFENMSTDEIKKIEALKGHSDLKALNFDANYAFCYDVYCFSRMICSLTKANDEGYFYRFSQVLSKSCMHSTPKVRLPADQLLVHPSFKSPYLLALDFLGTYMTHSDEAKEVFFRSFSEEIFSNISEELFCRNLLPKMFESTIFLDYPCRSLLAEIFHSSKENVQRSSKPKVVISLQNFQKFITPLIIHKFMITERHTRIILLENFSGYLKALTDSDLMNVILPQICFGVFDKNDRLSVLSIQSLGCLANRLNAAVVLNCLRRTEDDLCKSGKLSSASVNSHRSNNAQNTNFSNSKNAYSSIWPRSNLFYEAAPKIGRCSREIPCCEKKSSNDINGVTRPLAQLAVFSEDYDPSKTAYLLNSCNNSPVTSTLTDGDVIKLPNSRSTSSTKTDAAFSNNNTSNNENSSNSHDSHSGYGGDVLLKTAQNTCEEIPERNFDPINKSSSCNKATHVVNKHESSAVVDKSIDKITLPACSVDNSTAAGNHKKEEKEEQQQRQEEKILNEEREVDAILTLMEPKIVQKPSMSLSPLNYSLTTCNTLNGSSLENSVEEDAQTGWEDAWNSDT
uniref:Protein kinase domain-containing protein n=1 Tax=Trichobilharzia regenti TaxID=157069 RepID=A0AA85JFD7_TRIRE|nr:unnamed protein product [Trichobilharzia regenti]